jgi:hypothetical protein
MAAALVSDHPFGNHCTLSLRRKALPRRDRLRTYNGAIRSSLALTPHRWAMTTFI